MMDWNKILDDQSGAGYVAVPAGKYPIVVLEAEATTASTGAKMIVTTCVIENGPYADKKVITNIVFSVDNPQAMKFTLRKLNALGVSKETLAAQNPSIDQLAKMITGAKAEAEITVRKYEGEDTNDVKSFKAHDNAAIAGAGVPAPPVPVPPTPTSDIPIPRPEPEASPEPTTPNDEEPF